MSNKNVNIWFHDRRGQGGTIRVAPVGEKSREQERCLNPEPLAPAVAKAALGVLCAALGPDYHVWNSMNTAAYFKSQGKYIALHELENYDDSAPVSSVSIQFVLDRIPRPKHTLLAMNDSRWIHYAEDDSSVVAYISPSRWRLTVNLDTGEYKAELNSNWISNRLNTLDHCQRVPGLVSSTPNELGWWKTAVVELAALDALRTASRSTGHIDVFREVDHWIGTQIRRVRRQCK